ncbi:MAG: AI-2E family transporter [Betaproteobacteria bacterium]
MGDRRRRDLLTPLLITLGLILLLAFWVFRPFVLAFTVAACVALLLAPAQKRLTAALGGHPGLAAATLVLATTVLILVPVLTSLFVLVQQASAFLDWVRSHPVLGPDALQRLWQELPQRYPGLRFWFVWLQAQVSPGLEGGLAQLAGGASGLLQGVLGRVTHAVADLGLFLLMLFFLLRDGGQLKAELRPVSPFSEQQESLVFEHLESTIKGALQAVIVVPVVQGVLAGVGFMLFGIPSPFVWGTAVILAATVPIAGSPLGWLPAVGYLFARGQVGPAIGLALYCLVIVSGSDNVVKPMLLRGTAHIHPLLGFLSILGGVLAFGVFGFLIGPVVLSLVLSAIRIYRLDVLRAGGTATPEAAPSAAAAGASSETESVS